MADIKVRKKVVVEAVSERDLEYRVDRIFGEIRARSGAVLDVRWSRSEQPSGYRASILCELPLG